MDDFFRKRENAIINFYRSEKRCFVKRSEIHSIGLFAKDTIYENEFITFYPGVLLTSPVHRDYCVEWKEFPTKKNSSVYFLDPFIPGVDLSVGCAHLANSCHPSMRRPFNVANAEFVWRKTYPYIALHAKNCTINEDSEILIDYHWMLTYTVPLFCSCEICCAEKFDDFVRGPEHKSSVLNLK
jgi:hypothetical protein